MDEIEEIKKEFFNNFYCFKKEIDSSKLWKEILDNAIEKHSDTVEDNFKNRVVLEINSKMEKIKKNFREFYSKLYEIIKE